MYDGREVYPLAPLVYVTAEIQFSYEPDVVTQQGRDEFATRVRDRLPLLNMEIVESDPLTAPDGSSFREQTPRLRAFAENEKTSMTLSAHVLTIETVEYDEFQAFLEWIRVALEALAQAAPKARMVRAGLRYIDEIRVPDIVTSRDWDGWINPNYLGPLRASESMSVEAITGAMVLPQGDDCEVLVRWGEVQGVSVINQDSRLRVERAEPSRFFVYDVDSFWQPEANPLVHEADLLRRFSALHEPVGVMFTSVLTERLKSIFRGHRGK